MPRLSRHLLFCLLLAAVAGCSSSKGPNVIRDDSGDAPEMRTRAMTLNMPSDSGYQGQSNVRHQFLLTAGSTCVNRDRCIEKDGYLHFKYNGGTRSVMRNYSPIIIMADSRRFSWPEFTDSDEELLARIDVHLAVSVADLRSIAFAENVSVQFGGRAVDFGFDQRRPMRELIAELQGGILDAATP